MITDRQKKLLKTIVENYIKTARPVSSKALCKRFKCSSATIRNEMASLEGLGLLQKTHTSSGRVPSDKGYRYYVDNIMKPEELSDEDVMRLGQIFQIILWYYLMQFLRVWRLYLSLLIIRL